MGDQNEKILVNSKHMGKYTNVDLIRHVATILIEFVDELGEYIFSDQRLFNIIPTLMETMLEFVYGPCVENQIFLCSWRKFMQVLDFFLCAEDLGNYSGLQLESHSKLRMLAATSELLLATSDIKDPKLAK